MKVSRILARYRAEREAVVVLIDRIDTCIAHLLPVLGNVDSSALSREHINGYVAGRVAAGVKPQTARRELTALRAALRLAWADRQIPHVPPVPMPPRGPRSERVLSPAEIGRIISAASEHPRLTAALQIFITTGARVGAVCELTWDRVDLVRRRIDLRAPHPKAARRKGRAVVPITTDIARRLAAYRRREPELRRRYATTEAVRVIGLTPSGLRGALHAAARAAGVARVTPHVLRHSVATHLLRRSISLPHVSLLLGHSSIQVTADVYGHLQPDDLAGAARILGRLAGSR